MTLRELEYIVAVAEHRSFSRAAEAVHVSQPTLSAQVRKLEAELGLALFERASRQVLPTEAGRAVIASARRILAESDNLRDIARTARDPLSGRFRLGAIPTLAGYVFPEFVPKAAEALPKLKLVLVEEKTDALVARLKGGRLDAALLALPLPEGGLEMVELFDDPFFFATRAGQGKGRAITPGELKGESLLLLEDGHCLRDQSLEVCRIAGAGEDADFRATSLETLRQMVRAGSGQTLMPEVALRDGDGLDYVPFEGDAMKRTVALAFRPTTSRRDVIERIAGLLKR